MKRLFNAYLSFTRTERMGILALLCCIVILIIVKATMHLWVNPDFDKARQIALSKKWAAFKNADKIKSAPQPYNNSSYIENNTSSQNTVLKPFPFDPNTIDASGLKQLGLSEKTIAIFLNWRSKGKHFYKKEDLKPLYTLSESDYNQLAPFIRIKLNKINLNTADSATLVSLPGIGAKLAHKILEYKKEIGKYESVDQLMDVYHFQDTTMQILKQRLSTR